MDYKEVYLKLFRAAEKAAEILIAVQQECEEMYINAPELSAAEEPAAPDTDE